MNVIFCLLFAYVAALFGLNEVFIKGMHELFNKEVTDVSYYFVFFVLGLIFEIIAAAKN